MTDKRIIPIVMPKWGLSMKEGKVTGWLVEDGKQDQCRRRDPRGRDRQDRRRGRGGRRRRAAPARRRGRHGLSGQGAARRHRRCRRARCRDRRLRRLLCDAGGGGGRGGGRARNTSSPTCRRAGCATPSAASGGETVILIHGFGGDLDNWLFNIDALAESATVYALDLPGHGQSTKSIADPSVAGLAKTVIALHGRGRHREGASRRPFAGRRHRHAGRAAGQGPREVADPHRQRRPRAGHQHGLYRRLHRRGVAPRPEAGARAALRRSRRW